MPGLARAIPDAPDVEPPSPFLPPLGCAFHPRCPLAFDRCRTEIPKLVALGSTGGKVACFAADRGAAPVS
jgi:oligopeptide/dipeptide ABC transporter ATP-binding protein